MKIIKNLLLQILTLLHGLWSKKNFEHNARFWSNQILSTVAHNFTGDIANISGGKDQDKQHKTYKEYFSNARSYTITNYIKELDNDIVLDLSKPIDKNHDLY